MNPSLQPTNHFYNYSGETMIRLDDTSRNPPEPYYRHHVLPNDPNDHKCQIYAYRTDLVLNVNPIGRTSHVGIPQAGWELCFETLQPRAFDTPRLLVVPLHAAQLREVELEIGKALHTPLNAFCLKHTVTYPGAFQEYRQLLEKQFLTVYLRDPYDKRPLHYFWIGAGVGIEAFLPRS